jgi:hypothetical protein
MRSCGLTAIVAFFMATSALAQPPGQVVSYFGSWSGTDFTIISEVPANGFVLTDIISPYENCNLELIELTPGMPDVWKVIASLTLTNNLTSGVAFTPGKTVRARSCSGGHAITLAGYIPTTAAQSNVPAVSTWGLVVLGLLVVSAGSMVMVKRRAAD